MTNPTATPTDAATTSGHHITQAPEETTLSASLNSDAAPSVRLVTTACHVVGNPPANGALATRNGADGTAAPSPSSDSDEEKPFFQEWRGAWVGYTICKPRNFESRTR